MTDIVDRLLYVGEVGFYNPDPKVDPIRKEAAAEITRLRAKASRADRLLHALAPMLDDEPSLDEQRAGRAALAAYWEADT